MRAAVFTLLALTALGVAPRSARACSACGTDPASATLGAERPAAGLRLGLEEQLRQKDFGSDTTLHKITESRLQLLGQYAVRDAVFVEASLPFFYFDEVDGSGERLDRTWGPGDLQLGVRGEVRHALGHGARGVLVLNAAVKAPTGVSGHFSTAEVAAHHGFGAEPFIDAHLQPGTGSWDSILGAWYVAARGANSFYLGALARLNGSNGRDYHYGDSLTFTLGARRSLLTKRQLAVSLEGQLHSARQDGIGGGYYDVNTGGTVAWATAGATYALTDAVQLRASLQVPVAQWLFGAQREHLSGLVGVSFDGWR